MASRPSYIIRDETTRKTVLALISVLDLSKPWEVEVKPFADTRTARQNRLYFRWLGILSAETGESKDRLHEAFKAMFLEPSVVNIGGREVIVHTSKDKKVGTFAEFMNRVHAFAASDLGIALPIPEEMHSR